MKKSFIMILAVILLCCGCKAEYTLTIHEDDTVTEKIKLLEDSDFFAQYSKSSVQLVLSSLIEPHLDYFNKYSYKIDELYYKEEAGYLISNEFPNIEKYMSVTKIDNQYAGELTYLEDGNKITLKINGKLGQETQEITEQYAAEEGVVNIKLPNRKVYEHNADSYDEETGTYTWNINNVNEREISITYAKKADKHFPIVEIITIIAFISIFIAIGYIGTKLIGKKDSRNKI